MTLLSPLAAELDELLEPAADDLRSLNGARLFVTGGTGFVGSWFLESILWANARLQTGISAVILTRDAERFARKAPHLASASAFTFVKGDIRFPLDVSDRFDGVIHAATPASAKLNHDQPGLMLETIVDGGRAALALAARSGAIPFLLTSSGAVYGRQPPELGALSEDYGGGPDQLATSAAYGEGKRVTELHCAIAAAAYGVQAKIARLFAFVGPYLPLDRHFAIGNFIRDGLAGRPISVRGDGSSVRSYLYAADMIVWLWAIYVRGKTLRPYNVGSSQPIVMKKLADAVASHFNSSSAVLVSRCQLAGEVSDRYVPDHTRICRELGVFESVSLESGIHRTVAYHETVAAS